MLAVTLNGASLWWGLVASILTVSVIVYGVVKYMLGKLKNDIGEIKSAVTVNGKDTNSLADSTLRTEDKTDLQTQQLGWLIKHAQWSQGILMHTADAAATTADRIARHLQDHVDGKA